jgi:hypothetical protein
MFEIVTKEIREMEKFMKTHEAAEKAKRMSEDELMEELKKWKK